MKPEVVLALIFNKDGQVLAVSRKDDHNNMGFPGGKREQAESFEAAIKREVLEETGLVVSNPQNFHCAEDEHGYPCRVYLCDCLDFDPVLRPETGEGIVKWMDWDEFLSASKYHKKFNTEAKKVFELVYSNSVVQGQCYRNPRTDEMYEILHWYDYKEPGKTTDYLLVNSSYSNRPLVMPAKFLEGKVEWIPKVTFDYAKKEVYDATFVKDPKYIYTLAKRAKIYAIDAHNCVNQEYDDNPYSWHLADVVDVFHMFKHLLREPLDCDIIEAILWLHDVMEDTNRTYNDVRNIFGTTVADGVFAMTNMRGKKREERANSEYYKGLRNFEYGEFCKLCDRIANVGDKPFDMYRKEQSEFKDKLQKNTWLESMWEYLESKLFAKKMDNVG